MKTIDGFGQINADNHTLNHFWVKIIECKSNQCKVVLIIHPKIKFNIKLNEIKSIINQMDDMKYIYFQRNV